MENVKKHGFHLNALWFQRERSTFTKKDTEGNLILKISFCIISLASFVSNMNKSCVLIGNPTGHHGPILPTWDCLPRSCAKKRRMEQTYKVRNLWTIAAIESQKAAKDCQTKENINDS